MNSPFSITLRTFLAAALLAAPLLESGAQTKATVNDHPASQIVISYLRYAMGQDWEKSSTLIEAPSLDTLKARYVNRIKMAATIDDEISMCRALDCANLKEVSGLTSRGFYIRYHKGIQTRFEVDEKKLNQIISTMKVKLLSLAEETVEKTPYAHILVRTRHQNGDKNISSLDLISLIKRDGKWRVTLEAQRPLIENLGAK